MKALARLALAADFTALATVMLGSWTRIEGAGLTCPDWPLCRAQLLPSLGGGTVWEWTHRLLACGLAVLVSALLVAAWQNRSRSAFVTPTAIAIAGLFVAQVILGAATVRLGNAPISVVLHWATAMAFVAALCAMAVFATVAGESRGTRLEHRFGAGLCVMLAVTALVAFVTMCVGAYVSSSGAGLACLSIPQCAGNVVVYTPGQYVQMLHRLGAAATLICAAGALAWSWAQAAPPRIRIAVAIGATLVWVQVMLGLLNVTLRLPTDLREAHAVNAAFVFLAFFVAAIFAALELRPIRSALPLRENALQ